MVGSKGDNMRILILGHSGQIGRELHRDLSNHQDLVVLDRHRYDLRDMDKTYGAILDIKPDIICNCAAYTAVDKAEADKENAYKLNSGLVSVLARSAEAIQSKIIHISTDYVFDGEKTDPYVEKDKTNPISVYGASKLAGENELFKRDIGFLCFRTSWVYSTRRTNFMKTMLQLSESRSSVQVVHDQVGCPTSAKTVSNVITESIRQGLWEHKQKIYHVVNSGSGSWAEFAEAIFAKHQRPVNVERITSDKFPSKVARPKYSVLDNALIQNSLNVRIPHWNEGLNLVD